MTTQYLIAGNWKMNTTGESAKSLAQAVKESADKNSKVEVLVCPPFPYLDSVQEIAKGSKLKVGAQNCYFEAPGAFTGETAVNMLKDVGCSYVILGHSERRHILGETDAIINKKTVAALAGGVPVILCVGELLAERESNQTETVLDQQMTGGLAGITKEQLAQIVIAYEPVWAIGTGKTASPEQADSAHAYLRKWLSSHYDEPSAKNMKILYGGSVKPDNAQTLLSQPNVDGALVGGASLKIDQFGPIIEAAQALS
jgi:triosephosphate isomerase